MHPLRPFGDFPKPPFGPGRYDSRQEVPLKGDAEILKALQELLSAELTAINQYFIHARMLRNWRYMKLADHAEKESIGEMKHAQEAMDRILYLEGVPNMQKYMKINVGATVPEMMRVDLELEYDAVRRLKEHIRLSVEKADYGSRVLFERILVSEEEHIDWLEAQVQQIKDIGAEGYLAQQIEGGA
jgi:bacterioferritin